MPGNQTQSQAPLKVISINDFTAGIVNQTYNFSTTRAFTRAPNAGTKTTFSANTYGCMGLPGGGLLFGPTVTTTVARTPTWPGTTPANNSTSISGIVPGAQGGGIVIISAIVSGSYLFAAYEISVTNQPVTSVLYSVAGGTSATNLTPATFPFRTVLSNGTAFGDFLIFTAESVTATGGSVHYFNTIANGTMASGRSGWAIPANGRVWYLEFVPGSPNNISPLQYEYLSLISYTDPTISTGTANLTIGTQETIVDYDDISSFGGWGSISSSETLLIKQGTGGVIISGDIFNPTISRAPAVQGTNNLFGQAALTPIGLVYRSQGNGVWAWGGGASAQKISAQLSDSLFPDNPGANYQEIGPQPTGGLGFYNVQQIRNLIFTDGGFFYNMDTSSWWRLPPYSNIGGVGAPFGPIFYLDWTPLLITSSPNTDQIIDFSSVYMGGTNGNQLTYVNYTFDQAESVAFTPPVNHYNSFLEINPIELSDHMVEVQQIEFTIQGNGELFVSILGVDGITPTPATVSTNVSSQSFQRYRLNCSFITDVIVLQIGWNSAGPRTATPILGSIEIKYRDTYPIATTNN